MSRDDHIAEGWERYRDTSLTGATQKQARLMKTAFYAGYAHCLKVVTTTGTTLPDSLVENATREVNEYTRSGE